MSINVEIRNEVVVFIFNKFLRVFKFIEIYRLYILSEINHFTDKLLNLDTKIFINFEQIYCRLLKREWINPRLGFLNS